MKSFILFIVFFIFTTGQTVAQRSAQVAMEVSVRVVKGASLSANMYSQVPLSGNELGDKKIGSLSMKAVDSGDFVISIPQQIKLTNAQGEKIDLPIKVARKNSGKYTQLTLLTKKKEQIAKNGSGLYRGALTAKIEYF